MALKTFVKVSGVNNLSDARYCAGMGVDQLGFKVYSEFGDAVDSQTFKEISEWVSGVEYVGEVDGTGADFSAILEEYPIQILELNDIDALRETLNHDVNLIFRTNNLDLAMQAEKLAGDKLSYVILEVENKISDLENTSSLPLVIEGGFNAENILDQLEKLSIKGVALKGGDEIRPGFKNFDELADTLEVLEIDDLD